MKKVNLSIILTGAVLVGLVSGRRKECIFYNESQVLSIVGYNTTSHICCPQSAIGIYSLHGRGGLTNQCCGTGVYHIENELCCSGTKQLRYSGNGSPLTCCGHSAVVETDEQYCCKAEMHQKTRTKNACCAGGHFDSSSLKCCQNDNGTVGRTTTLSMECCNEKPYDPETHWCEKFEGPTKLFYEWCGKELYDTRDKICCGGKLHRLPGNNHTRCCGSETFDDRIERCCYTSNTPFKAHKDAECCSSESYFVSNERCCVDIVHRKVLSTQDCCSRSLYDTRVEGCCDKAIYNRTIDQCCVTPEKSSVAPKDESCCGGQSYQPDSEVCCDHRFKIPKSKLSDTHCCLATNKSYNKALETCGEERPLCGNTLFDPKHDLCCGGLVVHPGALSQGKRCCHPGSKAYDPDTEICCDSLVLRKSTRPSCSSNRSKVHNSQKSVVKGGNNESEPESTGLVYSICRACRWNLANFQQILTERKLNVCQRNVFRVTVLRVTRNRSMRKGIKTTEVKVRINKRLNFEGNDTDRRRKIRLLLPCQCRDLKPDQQKILVTNNDLNRRKIRLGDADILMPYEKDLRKGVKAELLKCPAEEHKRLSILLRDILDN